MVGGGRVAPAVGSSGGRTRRLPAAAGVLVGVAVRGGIFVATGGLGCSIVSGGTRVVLGVDGLTVLRVGGASPVGIGVGTLMGGSVGSGVWVVGLSYLLRTVGS